MTTAERIQLVTLRERLQAMHKKYPDSSHGEGYFNSGIRAALSALNTVMDVDTHTRCERIVDRNMGGGFCGAHHGWLGQFNRSCELAQTPWTWDRDDPA